GDLAGAFERARRVEAEHSAVELVRTGLGDDVENAAGGPPVLRHVTAADDVELFDELERERRADGAVRGVVDRRAVEHVVVFGRRRAADRHAVRVALRAGNGLGDGLERARARALAAGTRHRDAAREILTDAHTGGARTDVDRRRSR